MRKLVLACLSSLALMGCATVPTLYNQPEAVADQIGGNAIAYNQAYGRAIADQVLLNVLRARDRLPLYHLSMSGIGDASELARAGGFTIGEVSLGDGNGGVGGVSGEVTLTTKPTYTLNPFNHGARGTTAFEPIPPEFFAHYWNNEWPRDVLVFVMVDSMTAYDRHSRRLGAYDNTASSFQSACETSAPEGRQPGEGCAFLAEVRRIMQAGPNVRFAGNCGEWPTHVEGRPQQPRTCDPRITILNERGRVDRTYHVELRALDDMIYYIGSLLRVSVDDGAWSTHVRVIPAGLYSDDTLPATERRYPDPTAPLFRVSESRTRRNPGYAAAVQYEGHRFVAGPAVSSNCIVGDASCEIAHDGDRSALVLSLLTQLAVLSQSDAAQEAPERVLAR